MTAHQPIALRPADSAPCDFNPFDRPAYIARARLYERRLKAALHRSGRRADMKALYRRLRRVRQCNERAVVMGPYPHLASLRYFLADYGPAIERGCKSVAGVYRLPDLPGAWKL